MLWLVASATLLVVTLLRPDVHGGDRTALVWLTPLYWLSFPLGHLGVLAGIQLRLQLYLGLNIVPSILAEGLFLWTVLTVLGYLQWFVLLPWGAAALGQAAGHGRRLHLQGLGLRAHGRRADPLLERRLRD